MPTIKKALTKARGQDASTAGLSVHLSILGMKLTTPSGHTFANPYLPPMTTCAVGVGLTQATTEQRDACLALWLSAPGASSSYFFPAHRLPTIADGCADRATTTTTTQETDDE